MKRAASLILLAPLLGGCVAMAAVSGAGLAAQAAQGKPVKNEQLQPVARQACSERAAQYGSVHIIDVQQASIDRIIVWGTVDDGKQRRSFQCNFGTKIVGFTLRAIKRPS
jgi:PBP1b-binding outer membrane lipoprotein LpoB